MFFYIGIYIIFYKNTTNTYLLPIISVSHHKVYYIHVYTIPNYYSLQSQSHYTTYTRKLQIRIYYHVFRVFFIKATTYHTTVVYNR